MDTKNSNELKIPNSFEENLFLRNPTNSIMKSRRQTTTTKNVMKIGINITQLKIGFRNKYNQHHYDHEHQYRQKTLLCKYTEMYTENSSFIDGVYIIFLKKIFLIKSNIQGSGFQLFFFTHLKIG
ncbi:hypothetical protein DERF_010372 [Dermatophagoides farinae]|uniref:Uncharacterized protein n=1 Tax=Dermatophagoides farinae TaxID=6954 RepID=A0A922HY95_DERFA|nr:hypothetical protein DERF_010372 [Dermatophagoides farinae]